MAMVPDRSSTVIVVGSFPLSSVSVAARALHLSLREQRALTGREIGRVLIAAGAGGAVRFVRVLEDCLGGLMMDICLRMTCTAMES